jgi:hypothetical protein
MNRLVIALALFVTALPALAIPLSVLPWDGEIAARKFQIAHDKEVVEISYLHPAARSAPPIKLPADAKELRLITPDRKNADGTPAAVPLVLPEGIKTPLLLIIPDKDAITGVRTLILEDDLQSFKWGTIRLMNVTPQPLVFRCDKDLRALAPGWKPIDVDPGGRTRNVEILLYLKENLQQPVYSSVWEHREDKRQLVFVVPSPDRSMGDVAFKIVPEIRLDAEVPAR